MCYDQTRLLSRKHVGLTFEKSIIFNYEKLYIVLIDAEKASTNLTFLIKILRN